MKKNLKSYKQCQKCPWKKDVDPNEIPNGYCKTKHTALRNTIADKNNPDIHSGALHVMCCHEHQEAHCIGWLVNQLGEGNNIPLRIRMMQFNLSGLELEGDQHHNFEDTLAAGQNAGEIPP